MGDSAVGLQARLMSQALRKLTGTISKTNTCCIFINQLREKIGVMFGNPETTTGGNALKFYSSVRIDIRRVTSLKDGDNVYGNHVRVKVVKTRSRLHSARQSLTSCSDKASTRRERFLTSAWKTTSWARAAAGSHTMAQSLAKVATRLSSS